MTNPGGDTDINEKILEALESNGTLDSKGYRRLVLLSLYNIGGIMSQCKIGLTDIQKRVENLEENSIMLTAKRHSKISWTIGIGFAVLIIATILHLGLDGWLFELFNIPPIPVVIP